MTKTLFSFTAESIYKCSFIYTCFSVSACRNNSDNGLNNSDSIIYCSDCCLYNTVNLKNIFKGKFTFKANFYLRAFLISRRQTRLRAFVRRVTDENTQNPFINNLRKVYILSLPSIYYKNRQKINYSLRRFFEVALKGVLATK